MQRAGVDARHLGRDDESLARVGVFVELHTNALLGVSSIAGTGRHRNRSGRTVAGGSRSRARRTHAWTTWAGRSPQSSMPPRSRRLAAARRRGRNHRASPLVGAPFARRAERHERGAVQRHLLVECVLRSTSSDAIVRGVEVARCSGRRAVCLVVAAESVSPAVEFSAAVGAAMDLTLGQGVSRVWLARPRWVVRAGCERGDRDALRSQSDRSRALPESPPSGPIVSSVWLSPLSPR